MNRVDCLRLVKAHTHSLKYVRAPVVVVKATRGLPPHEDRLAVAGSGQSQRACVCVLI